MAAKPPSKRGHGPRGLHPRDAQHGWTAVHAGQETGKGRGKQVHCHIPYYFRGKSTPVQTIFLPFPPSPFFFSNGTPLQREDAASKQQVKKFGLK